MNFLSKQVLDTECTPSNGTDCISLAPVMRVAWLGQLVYQINAFGNHMFKKYGSDDSHFTNHFPGGPI